MGTPFLWPGVRFDGQKRVSEVQWTEHKKGQARPLRGLVGSPFEHANDASNEHDFCQGCQGGGVDADVQTQRDGVKAAAYFKSSGRIWGYALKLAATPLKVLAQ